MHFDAGYDAKGLAQDCCTREESAGRGSCWTLENTGSLITDGSSLTSVLKDFAMWGTS